MERSWDEQRGYLRDAVAALPGVRRDEAERRLAALHPVLPDRAGYEPITDLTRPFDLGGFSIAVDPQSGWLTRLSAGGGRLEASRALSGPKNPLGQFWYQTFSAADYLRFHRQYNVNRRETWFWSVPDFTKPGLEDSGAESKTFFPRLVFAGRRGDSLLLLMEMPAESWTKYGAPKPVSVEIGPARAAEAASVLSFRVQWFEQPASRMPEALWFSFVPKVRGPGCWKMDKLGRWISPLEVIRDGNRHLHAVGDGGVRCEEEAITIRSLDAALVAPGQPSLLDFNNRQPNLAKGFHFNLYNNLWGTNFPMWYEEDALFRYEMIF
jgi:hypothetical protein